MLFYTTSLAFLLMGEHAITAMVLFGLLSMVYLFPRKPHAAAHVALCLLAYTYHYYVHQTQSFDTVVQSNAFTDDEPLHMLDYWHLVILYGLSPYLAVIQTLLVVMFYLSVPFANVCLFYFSASLTLYVCIHTMEKVAMKSFMRGRFERLACVNLPVAIQALLWISSYVSVTVYATDTPMGNWFKDQGVAGASVYAQFTLITLNHILSAKAGTLHSSLFTCSL